MSKQRYHIALAEPSLIIREGLNLLLHKTGYSFRISHIDELEELHRLAPASFPDLIILNPLLLIHREKQVRNLKAAQPGLKWAALLYHWVDQAVLSHFDLLIEINDSQECIREKLQQVLEKQFPPEKKEEQESLSERELEVLKALVNGASNKEIADALHISLHTVISHRKNITRKTSVKSLSGLTLYAITHKIISLDNLPPA